MSKQKCVGENCNSTDEQSHSVECLFEHFCAYTSAHKETDDVIGKLKKAYFDGHEAGTANLQWLPIETAPMDETAVLGYQKLAGEAWVIAPMYFNGSAWLMLEFHTANTEFEMHPTHWMSVPNPPSESAIVQAKGAAE